MKYKVVHILKTYPQEWGQEVPLLAPRGQLDQPVLKRKVNPKMNELWWSGHDMIENFFWKKAKLDLEGVKCLENNNTD